MGAPVGSDDRHASTWHLPTGSRLRRAFIAPCAAGGAGLMLVVETSGTASDAISALQAMSISCVTESDTSGLPDNGPGRAMTTSDDPRDLR